MGPGFKWMVISTSRIQAMDEDEAIDVQVNLQEGVFGE